MMQTKRLGRVQQVVRYVVRSRRNNWRSDRRRHDPDGDHDDSGGGDGHPSSKGESDGHKSFVADGHQTKHAHQHEHH